MSHAALALFLVLVAAGLGLAGAARSSAASLFAAGIVAAAAVVLHIIEVVFA